MFESYMLHFSAAADELIRNLRMIFRGNFKHITDMNQFKGQYDIPDIPECAHDSE